MQLTPDLIAFETTSGSISEGAATIEEALTGAYTLYCKTAQPVQIRIEFLVHDRYFTFIKTLDTEDLIIAENI